MHNVPEFSNAVTQFEQSPQDREVSRLLDIVLHLATDDNAPTADMSALSVVINALGVAVDESDNPEVITAALVGALAWIARHHWPEVSSEIRNVTGEALQ